MRLFLLGARFVLEILSILAVVAAAMWAGGSGLSSLLFGLAGAAAMIVAWWLLIAPRATRSPIPLRWRALAGALVMLVAAGLLAWAREPLLASLLAIAVIVDTLGLYATGAAEDQLA